MFLGNGLPLNRALLMRYLTNLGTEDAILVLPSAALYPRIIFSVLPFSVTFGGAIEIVQPAVGRNGEWAGILCRYHGRWDRNCRRPVRSSPYFAPLRKGIK